MKFIPWTIIRLKELVDLWNDAFGEHFPMREDLFLQNSFKDINVCYDASQIALNEADQVIGFIVAKRWQEKLDINMRQETGWIQAIVVKKEYRNQGIGSHLLQHAEASLQESGMKEILLGKDPWHYFPGIPEERTQAVKWFTDKGYEQTGNDYDLINHYENDVPVLPTVNHAYFSILKEDEQEQFLAFLHRCFPGRWEYEALHYFARGGTGREFVVLKKNEEIIGFSRINDDLSPLIAQNVYWAPLFEERLGGIGPLGIDANERKQGYGIAIVQAAIYFLRNRDINKIVIDWTGLVDFYKKLGYDVWKGYVSFRKSLSRVNGQ